MITWHSAKRGHVLVLGDSPFSSIVLEEFTQTDLLNGHRIVVLSRDKPEGLSADCKGRIHHVKGDPTDPADLARANPHTTVTILVNCVGEENCGSKERAIVAALLDRPAREAVTADILVVSETEEDRKLVEASSGGRAWSVCPISLFSRIIAQASRQKKLDMIYRELLSFSGNELYFLADPSLEGESFGRSLRAFSNACPIGVRQGDSARINPPMNTVLGPDSQLIILAESLSGIERNDAILPAPVSLAISEDSVTGAESEAFILLGWNRFCPEILREIDRYCKAGSKVLLVCGTEITLPPMEKYGNLAIETRTAKIDDANLLNGIQWQCYENIIIPGTGFMGDTSALAVLEELKKALSVQGFANNITAVTWDAASGRDRDEDVLSVSLSFRILAQLVLRRELYPVIDEITTPQGAEIYLKPVENYVHTGIPVDFYTILESARRKNETAIGFVSGQNLVLNPPKSEKKAFYHLDKIIVLADAQ